MDVYWTDGGLSTISDDSLASEAEALASIAALTTMINDEWQMLMANAHAGSVVAADAILGDRGQRLRKWLDQLHEITRQAAERFRGSSFSISVGTAGVNVTVEFAIEQH